MRTIEERVAQVEARSESRTKAVRKTGPARRKTYLKTMKIKYGLSPLALSRFFKRSAGYCLICESQFSGNDPVVDHDHVSGKVRGLLCNQCNSLLGFARDDTTLLLAAAHYLDVRNGKSRPPKHRGQFGYDREEERRITQKHFVV